MNTTNSLLEGRTHPLQKSGGKQIFELYYDTILYRRTDLIPLDMYNKNVNNELYMYNKRTIKSNSIKIYLRKYLIDL